MMVAHDRSLSHPPAGFVEDLMLSTFKLPRRLRRRLPSKPPPFPQEILELILNQCASEDQRSCSLASQFLRYPAQKALFHRVKFYLYRERNDARRNGELNNLLASNPRIASYVCHLRLILTSSSQLPEALPHLTRLRVLSLWEYRGADWQTYPAKIRDALYTLMRAPQMQTLNLRNIVNFPLAAALPLKHLKYRPGPPGRIYYSGPETQIPYEPEGPSSLQSLGVGSDYALRRLLNFPFLLDPSRLVRFDAIVTERGASVSIQYILDICAPTLQELCLRAEPTSNYFSEPLTFTSLTSLTDLTLPLTYIASLQWSVRTLSTLPPSVFPVALTLRDSEFPILRVPHFWGRTDCMPFWAEIDDLPLRKLCFHRKLLWWTSGSAFQQPKPEELLPKLAKRGVLMGPITLPPPPIEVQKRSLWKQMLS
ncbi:hypothetical protein DXG01_009010 [Tephrocybe rancida]|nr:hypothetical protein DXG01_009010 [Tephrocybe rancida]